MKKSGLLGALALAATLIAPAVGMAQSGAPSVLTIARGASSQDINVAVNRAVVLEAARPFAEVSVANPGIADVAALSNQTIYILGKAAGRTTLTLLSDGGRLIANVTITVGPDLSEFKTRLKEILPGERIEVRTANDGVVLSGTVSGARKVSRALELAERYAPGRVTNMMSVGGTQQVMLKTRFAEVQRNASKELGFNLEVLAPALGNLSLAGVTGDRIGQSVLGTDANGDVVRTVAPTASGESTGALQIGYLAGGFGVNLVIDALEGKGVARTLAEPNLVALSGDAASFLAGGEYPIPVPADDGAIGIEFRPFGISLGFTPTVIDGDLINLQIAAESSALDNSVVIQGNGVTFNGFSTRRAETTVEMRDGQSFAIAGLLQDSFVDNAAQVPWIGDVPVLGALFRSSDFQRQQTELVIIVSVHLVTPTTEDALSLPTDRVRIPREHELFLFGNVEGSGPASDVAAGNFEGAYGYVTE